MDRAGVEPDGPLRSRTACRVYFSLRPAGVVALLVMSAISGDVSSLWWIFVGIFVALGVIAVRWRRAHLL